MSGDKQQESKARQNRSHIKSLPNKHKVGYLFRKTKVKQYLFKAFLLFTRWEEETEITRAEFKKKLSEFLKR